MTLPVLLMLLESAFKATAVIAVAAVAMLVLRRAPARARAAVWSMALAGIVLFPVATKLIPRWDIPVPRGVSDRLSVLQPKAEPRAGIYPIALGELEEASKTLGAAPVRGSIRARVVPAPARSPWLQSIQTSDVVVAVWLIGLGAVLLWQVAGWIRVWTIVRRGHEPLEARWVPLLDRVVRAVGVTRPVRIVVSSEISAPATWGWRRPVVLLPKRAEGWIWERREVVLLHELVHVVRFDWPLRMLARLAAALYWFNPLSWWALHRLHTEQELACDEEVIALGTRPSTYASHLLDIAKSVVPQPMFGVAALGMARKSRVEGRIMAILKRKKHRRVGMVVMIPAAVLTAVLIPVFAALYPSSAGAQPASAAVVEQPPRPATPELRDLVRQVREVEEEMEVHLDGLDIIEEKMRPHLDEIEDLHFELNEEEILAIEERMEPYHARIEEIQRVMEPILAEIGEIEFDMEPIHLEMEKIDIGDLRISLDSIDADSIHLSELMEIVQRQMEPMQEQLEIMQQSMQPHLEKIEELQAQLAPFHEQMEGIHLEMEPLHLEMEELHKSLEPLLEGKLAHVHEALEPFHAQMEELERELEPFQERIEEITERIDAELVDDIEALLRDELSGVVGWDANFRGAAEKILERSGMHIDDDELSLHISRSRARRILNGVFESSSVVSSEEFGAAIERAANAVDGFRVNVEN